MEDKRVRLNLIVSPQLNELLESLAAAEHSTKSDILRKAIALFEMASKAKKEGNGIGLITKQREVLTEIVGL